MIRIVKGVDGVARGVILLHKRKQLERPIQSVCPLEIRSAEHEPEQGACQKRWEPTRERRRAAVDAASRIKNIFRDDD